MAKIPSEHHVLRYVRKNLLRRDEDRNVLGIYPQALEHKPGETYLSVTWIEHFSDDYEEGFSEAAIAIGRQLRVKKSDGFSAARVGTIGEICQESGVRVRVTHEPEPPENEGHSALRELQRADQDLLDLLAADAFVDTRLDSEIPRPQSD